MLSRWRMQEQHGREVGLSQVQYVFLELPKYSAGDDPQTLVDKWAYFFREAKNLNVVPPALSEGPFREALEVTRTATFTPEDWEIYERAKMAEQDALGALAVAHEEGEQKGHRSGLAEGELKGELKGKRDALLRLFARAGIALTGVTATASTPARTPRPSTGGSTISSERRPPPTCSLDTAGRLPPAPRRSSATASGTVSLRSFAVTSPSRTPCAG